MSFGRYFVIKFKTYFRNFSAVNVNMKKVRVEGFIFIFNLKLTHDQRCSRNIELSKSILLQKLNTCFVNNFNYGIISNMIAIIDISNTDRNGNSCKNFFGKLK